MTKADIVNRLAAQTGLSTPLARLAVDRILLLIEESLTRGENVELRGFGVFKATLRKQRIGRNPRTGEAVPIPAGRTVRFKPGSEMLRSRGGLGGEPLREEPLERTIAEEDGADTNLRESGSPASPSPPADEPEHRTERRPRNASDR